MGAKFRRKVAAGQARSFDRITRAGAVKLAQRVLEMEAILEGVIRAVGHEQIAAGIRAWEAEKQAAIEAEAAPETP